MVSIPLEKFSVPPIVETLFITSVPPLIVTLLRLLATGSGLAMVSDPPLIVSVPPVAVTLATDWFAAGRAAPRITLLAPRQTLSKAPGRTPVLQFPGVSHAPPEAALKVIVHPAPEKIENLATNASLGGPPYVI